MASHAAGSAKESQASASSPRLEFFARPLPLGLVLTPRTRRAAAALCGTPDSMRHWPSHPTPTNECKAALCCGDGTLPGTVTLSGSISSRNKSRDESNPRRVGPSIDMPRRRRSALPARPLIPAPTANVPTPTRMRTHCCGLTLCVCPQFIRPSTTSSQTPHHHCRLNTARRTTPSHGRQQRSAVRADKSGAAAGRRCIWTPIGAWRGRATRCGKRIGGMDGGQPAPPDGRGARPVMGVWSVGPRPG